MKVKDLIEKLKGLEDFEIEVTYRERIEDEELLDQTYPYPYNVIKCDLSINDVGYSDKVVCIGIEEEV